MDRRVVCVVPARMASSRFPGKPLHEIDGVPLVVRSARRALEAGCFARVLVASEDSIVVERARAWGLEAVATPVFPTGTDRVAWVGERCEEPWVLNLQGDEPLFPLDLLRELAGLLPTAPEVLWTAADLALDAAGRQDPDVVKIGLGPGVRVREGLDFTRESPPAGDWAVHVGVYAGARGLLSRFSRLESPALERERRIEPLRALAHGMEVRAVVGSWPRVAVDRMEHISLVLESLKNP